MTLIWSWPVSNMISISTVLLLASATRAGWASFSLPAN